MHLKLRRELRRWEKSRWRLDYCVVNKIMCCPEGGYSPSCKEKLDSLLKKGKPFTKKVHAGA